MPTTIPFDPSLVLGNLVDRKVLDNLLKIAELQEPIDAAQYELNDKLALKNSLKATIIELTDMGIDTKELSKKSLEVNELINKAGVAYANTRIKQEELMQGLRGKVLSVHESVESPVDWNRTMITERPLSSDSMKMDIQYFSFDENKQTANNSLSSIKEFVSNSFGGWLEPKTATDVAGAVVKQITNQQEHHDISGTLILTAACTHKSAKVLAPFILDVDKAVRVWNAVFPNDEDKINMNPAKLARLKDEEGTSEEKYLTLISGATYGSSFVGMVHILKRTSTETDQDIESSTESIQSQFELGSWFANMSGTFGVDDTTASDIKNLFSTANVDSHVSLITTGIIPSIKSGEVSTTVKEFTDFNPATMMAQMAALANSTQADHKTMKSAAADARTGGELVSWNSAKIESVIAAVGKIAEAKDKVMNVQSMITAFEDYVDKAIAGNCGTPINFYIKRINRAQIAEMWLAKYFPKKFMAISGDDSPPPGAAPAAAPQAQGDSGNSQSSDDSNSN